MDLKTLERTLHPRVKICCIASIDEAWTAIRHGASALGLVSAMPSGPGIISDARIAEIASALPPGVSPFLLTSLRDARAIAAQARAAGVHTIQICDRLLTGSYTVIRDSLPGVSIVQVVHVSGPDALDEAMGAAPHVDAILLDSGNQALPVRELGGTGRTHDWTISKQIRDALDIPLFLAGGLTADNVAEALRQVGPFGIDVCSGVRTEGKLDETKLSSFFSHIMKNGTSE